MLKRAPHIAQMLKIQEVVPTITDLQVQRRFDRNNAVQLLEFCKHGDLMSLLEKTSDNPMQGKHLIKIFACRKKLSNFPYSIAVIQGGQELELNG